MRWKTCFGIVLLAGVLLPTVEVAAQTDADYEWKTWKTRRSHAGFNGHGSFYYQGQTFESKALDNQAVAMGLDKFDGILWGFGGYGLGHVGNGWRIGGGGFGVEAITTGIYTSAGGDKYNRELSVALGGGGFMVEYSPWMIGPINFGVGGLLGGGGVAVEMRQDKGAFNWNDLRYQYTGTPTAAENVSTDITQGFFMFRPYATIRVHVLDWMAVEAVGGYHLSTLSQQGWFFGDRQLSGKGPELDINRPFFRVGVAFGG